MDYRGTARIDLRTKNLVKRLNSGDIAVINHCDIDQVAADSLVKARIKAVVNADKSISGRYPNSGPLTLLKEGISIIDNVGMEVFHKIHEGDNIELKENQVWCNNQLLGSGSFLKLTEVDSLLKTIRKDLSLELDKFLHNTLDYALKEKDLILGSFPIPKVVTKIDNRPVLVVVRGHHYRKDLMIIKPYIDDIRPVLIGVDGGADVLLEFGYKPDLIIGDMDSVSDAALTSGSEILVHAYADGRAPGLTRVEELGLTAKRFPAPGTSEDIALLLAYEKGASLIVAVGTHFSMIDFLDKGRAGMGSTFLVRLKIGSILVDARGVSQIYNGRMKIRYLLQVVSAGIVTVLILVSQLPWSKELLRTFWLQIKLYYGF